MIRLKRRDYDDYIGHNGDILGATTFAYFDKKKGVGYLLFCNTAMTSIIDEEIAGIKDVLKSSFSGF